MLLSDRDLLAEIKTGALSLAPFEPAMVQPSSIDMRLDRWFRVFNNHLHTHIDPAEPQPDLTSLVEVPDEQPFVLHPGEFALASTLETITIGQSLAGRVEGKSSLGRLGLIVHSTAGFIDPGFAGRVTLELSNAAGLPITLWPGMKIGQLCVFRLSSPSEHPYGALVYGSRYQGQQGPTPSRAWQNWQTWPTTPVCDQCDGKKWVRIAGKISGASSGFETVTECQACNADRRIPCVDQIDFYDIPIHHLAHQTAPGVFDPNCPACKESAS